MALYGKRKSKAHLCHFYGVRTDLGRSICFLQRNKNRRTPGIFVFRVSLWLETCRSVFDGTARLVAKSLERTKAGN